ncbi:hypothetical protein RclHR1_06080001 [Rhizophagus clarus]|uniref:UBA/TS-N domain protein n=1 Tax=Rhizophagus clarus TaxID=94130 RepID=A0A2Z6S8N4_9GLOM|nr:hypothetical protein RclHR1_06080001 [Rhizophagus clarus]GES76221.1 UBA/TS-N domain protein [Rhizophagus clarus]
MDDLNELIWGSGSNRSSNQKSNNTSLNAMRGTTAPISKNSTTFSTSDQNIFLSQAINANSPVFKRLNKINNSDSDNSVNNQNFLPSSTSGTKTYSSNSPNNRSPHISPSLTSFSNNNSTDSLNDTFSLFNKKPTNTNLSLDGKRKLQEQEQQRKLQEENEKLKEHYDQTHFWDSLEGKSSNSSRSNGNRQPTGDIFDDILSGANQYGTSESISLNSNSQMKPPTVSHSSEETRWDLNFLSNGTNNNKISSAAADDLMDFGIFEKQNNSSSSVPTLNVDEDDDENPLGELAKPISVKSDTLNVVDDENPLGELAKPVPTKRDTSPHSERNFNNSPTPRNESKDHLIAQIVDMGFSVDEAEAALAVTDNGEDVSSAIEILVQQREVVDKMSMDKTKQLQKNFGRRRSNTADYLHRDDDDSEHGHIEKGRFSLKNHNLNVPRRNVYGISVSDGESSDRSSSSVSSNFLQQKEKFISTASEFGMHAFKKASAFYKQSKEVVNKALEDLQQDSEEDGSRKPRWMQNNDFQSDYADSPNSKFEERFQDSYDDSSSDDDYHPIPGRNRFVSVSSKAKDSSDDELPNPGRNKFLPVSSKLREDSDNDILSGRGTFVSTNSKIKESNEGHYRTLNQNESKKSPKPIVPSRSTKPDVNSSDSTYISPARRRPPSQNKSSPTRVTPSKPPRPVIHVSSEQLNKSETHKIKGNGLFKLGQFGEAEKFYSLAIDSLPNKHLLRAILYNNRAAAKLKNGDHRGCEEDCTLILQLIDDYTLPPPPGVAINLKDQYTKALLRRASAYEVMEKYDSARDDYQKLINADPGIGKSVSDGLRRCQKAIKMTTDSKSEVKDKNDSPLISSNQSSNQNDFNEFMVSDTSIPTQSASQSTFGAPLNAFGFIDPTVPTSTSSTYVDPNNPAVIRLRDQARQQEFEDAEKFRLKDHVDQKIMQWKGGKETNLRALISSLDVVLWDGIGWKTIGLHELVTPSQVKIRYMKAIAKVHPDKLNSETSIEQRLLANGIFSALNDAWDVFKVQNNL